MKRTSPFAVAIAGLTALPALTATPSAVLAQDVYLDSDEVIELEEIQLNESRRGVQTDTATSATVIDSEEVEARQATSFGELLDSVPNVNLTNRSTPSGSAVNIRGLGGWSGFYGTDGKVAVVVDGVTGGAEEIYRNGSMLMLEPELFRHVKVTRGPGEGFRFNSGAIGGTIEAQTKNATDFLEDGDTFAFRQKLGYETNGDGFSSTSILAFAPDEKMDALLFLGYREVGDTKDGSGNKRGLPPFKSPAGLAKVNYKLNDDNTLTFSYATTRNPQYDVPYDAQNPSFTQLVDRTLEDTTAYLAHRYNPIDNDLIDFEARLTYKEEVMTFESSTAGSSSLLDTDHNTETVGLRLENTSTFTTGVASHDLLVGLELKRRERTSILGSGPYAGQNSGSAPGGTDESVALYITDEVQIGNLTLTPQIRYEDQTLTSKNNGNAAVFGFPQTPIPDGTEYKKSAWTGALAARYEFDSGFAVFGTAAYNENLPILDDIRPSLFSGSTAKVNASEKAVTREIGVSFDGNGVIQSDDRLQAKLTVFRTNVWDVVSYSSRYDEVDLEGAELELNYASDLFYADFAAARTRGTVNGTSAPFPFAAPDSLQLTLGKKFLNDQLDVALETRYTYAQRRTTTTTAGSATSPTDDWTTYALSIGYKPDSGVFEGTEMRLGIENLTDETYRPYLTSSDRNAKGRNIKFTLAKTF